MDRIKEIDGLIKNEIQKGCRACNNQGVYHCGYPDECGNWDEIIKLENEKKLLLDNSAAGKV